MDPRRLAVLALRTCWRKRWTLETPICPRWPSWVPGRSAGQGTRTSIQGSKLGHPEGRGRFKGDRGNKGSHLLWTTNEAHSSRNSLDHGPLSSRSQRRGRSLSRLARCRWHCDKGRRQVENHFGSVSR